MKLNSNLFPSKDGVDLSIKAEFTPLSNALQSNISLID